MAMNLLYNYRFFKNVVIFLGRLQDQQGTLCSQQSVGHQDSQSLQGLEIYTKKLYRQRQPQKCFRRGVEPLGIPGQRAAG